MTDRVAVIGHIFGDHRAGAGAGSIADSIGAISIVSEPMKASSPMIVRCFAWPSKLQVIAPAPMFDRAPTSASPTITEVPDSGHALQHALPSARRGYRYARAARCCSPGEWSSRGRPPHGLAASNLGIVQDSTRQCRPRCASSRTALGPIREPARMMVLPRKCEPGSMITPASIETPASIQVA